MRSQILIFLVISYSVYSEDLAFVHMDTLSSITDKPENRSGKHIDVYTNHGDFKEVVDSYYRLRGRSNPRRFQRLPNILHDVSVYKNFRPLEKISPSELQNSAHLDRIDFHYPSVNLDTDKNGGLDFNIGSSEDTDSSANSGYVFMQSQKFSATESEEEGDSEYERNRRPMFKTSKFSHVQIIPKTTTISSIYENRYEELSMRNSTTPSPVETKNRINELLKKYLNKLYEKKYDNVRANVQSTSSPRFDSVDKTNKLVNTNTIQSFKNKAINKIKKFFSLFTIVQFNNTQCTATNTAGTYQGVCYTASQCTTEGGTALGNCASGYGVCCIFMGTCGGSGNQNCTYFQSPNYPDYYPSDGSVVVPTTTPSTNPSPTPDPRLPWNFGRFNWGRQNSDSLSCTFSVNKLNSNISKMRIDFEDLELTGPRNGTCSDERLVISGQNTNSQIPVICGYNTGQHVYVDVSSLSGPLQLSVLSGMGSRKRFKIRICQFADTCSEPSSNCLQYYTGVTGTISSFNYDQASMLSRSVPGYFNNLNYAICIRREEGYCSITYRNVVNGVEYPFQLTNVDDAGNMIIPPGQAGADIINCPDDYIVIDGTRLCGDKFNDGSVNDDFTMNADVTDTGAGPIVIPVRTDSMVTGMGFKLFYTQNQCTGV